MGNDTFILNVMKSYWKVLSQRMTWNDKKDLSGCCVDSGQYREARTELERQIMFPTVVQVR